MPQIPFADVPDHGRVWVFPATRELSNEEQVALLREVDAFLDLWAAHGAPLRSARELRDGWMLLVAVDEDAEAPSGCSIDALVNRLRAVGDDMGVTFIDHAPVWYRLDGAVRIATRSEFRALAKEGRVGPDSRVFDTSLTRLSVLRSAGLERPAAETWHGKAFFREQIGA